MSELYWITTLGHLNTLFIVGILIICVFFAAWLFSGLEAEVIDRSAFIKCFKKCLALIFMCSLGIVFVPSSRELYAIYGIGSIIDTVQESSELKKVPENVGNAINKYLESFNEGKK